MAESIIETRGGWASSQVTVGGKECTIIKSDSGIATFYWRFDDLSSSDTYVNLGTLPEGFRPICTYTIAHLTSVSPPYTAVGSLWISHGGALTLYKPVSVTDVYICGIYLTGL